MIGNAICDKEEIIVVTRGHPSVAACRRPVIGCEVAANGCNFSVHGIYNIISIYFTLHEN